MKRKYDLNDLDDLFELNYKGYKGGKQFTKEEDEQLSAIIRASREKNRKIEAEMNLVHA
jgi:hypothetical protein